MKRGRPKGVVSLDQAEDKLKTAVRAVEEALDRVHRLNERYAKMKAKQNKAG